MRAAVTQGTQTPLAIAELDDPTPLAGEVVVQITACGICGSDLHLSDALDFPGIVLGHEFAGVVTELGPDVHGWKVGERVAGFPLVGCGVCEACDAGATSKCLQAAQLGLQRPGAFAEYTTIAASSLFRIPDSIDNTGGALVEPLAVAHHALDRTPRDLEEPVLIIGGGPVGAAVALWARHLGAREVVVTDPVSHRRELAESVGATATIDPSTEDVASAFFKQCNALPGVVVECVGIPGMIQHAMDVAGPDARVTVVGVCMTDDQITPLVPLQKELSAQFVLYYRKADFTATIDALTAGELRPEVLVTGTIGLDELPDRFASLKHPTTDCKVIVTPNRQLDAGS